MDTLQREKAIIVEALETPASHQQRKNTLSVSLQLTLYTFTQQ